MLTALTFFLNLVWGLSLSTNAIWVTGVYHRGHFALGFIQMAAGFLNVFVLLGLPFLLKRYGLFYFGVLAYLLVCCASAVIAWGGFYAYIVSYVVIMACDGLFNVYLRSERVHHIDSSELGKVVGAMVLMNQLSMPLSGLLVAAAGYFITLPILFLSVAVLSAGVGCAIFPRLIRRC